MIAEAIENSDRSKFNSFLGRLVVGDGYFAHYMFTLYLFVAELMAALGLHGLYELPVPNVRPC